MDSHLVEEMNKRAWDIGRFTLVGQAGEIMNESLVLDFHITASRISRLDSILEETLCQSVKMIIQCR